MMTDELSESESSAESRPFNIFMDVLAVDWLLDDFPDAEGGVSGGVEILGLHVQCPLGLSPLINLVKLHYPTLTTLFLSPSATLTMCPKEGMTLMLMLLSIEYYLPVL